MTISTALLIGTFAVLTVIAIALIVFAVCGVAAWWIAFILPVVLALCALVLIALAVVGIAAWWVALIPPIALAACGAAFLLLLWVLTLMFGSALE